MSDVVRTSVSWAGGPYSARRVGLNMGSDHQKSTVEPCTDERVSGSPRERNRGTYACTRSSVNR